MGLRFAYLAEDESRLPYVAFGIEHGDRSNLVGASRIAGRQILGDIERVSGVHPAWPTLLPTPVELTREKC